MRKTAFCICENKGADHLCGKREADQHPCLCYLDTTIPLLSKAEISGLYPSPARKPKCCFSHDEPQMLKCQHVCVYQQEKALALMM